MCPLLTYEAVLPAKAWLPSPIWLGEGSLHPGQVARLSQAWHDRDKPPCTTIFSHLESLQNFESPINQTPDVFGWWEEVRKPGGKSMHTKFSSSIASFFLITLALIALEPNLALERKNAFFQNLYCVQIETLPLTGKYPLPEMFFGPHQITMPVFLTLLGGKRLEGWQWKTPRKTPWLLQWLTVASFGKVVWWEWQLTVLKQVFLLYGCVWHDVSSHFVQPVDKTEAYHVPQVPNKQIYTFFIPLTF